MVNYQNAKVYKIIDNTNGNIYVGSTCEPTLARRLTGHVGTYKQYLNGKCRNFMTSYNIIKNGDYDIVLLEDCPCENKDQLRTRERHYIESLDCVNKYIPSRSRQESSSAHYINHNDKFKQFRIDNKEKFKQYRLDNSEKIKEYNNKKHICQCGGKYTTINQSRHLKSPKHQNYIQNKIKKEYELLLELNKLRIDRQLERKEELNQVLALEL